MPWRRRGPNSLANALHGKALVVCGFGLNLLTLSAHVSPLLSLRSGCLEGLWMRIPRGSGLISAFAIGFFLWLMSNCSLPDFYGAVITLLLLGHSRQVSRMWQRWRVDAASNRNAASSQGSRNRRGGESSKSPPLPSGRGGCAEPAILSVPSTVHAAVRPSRPAGKGRVLLCVLLGEAPPQLSLW